LWIIFASGFAVSAYAQANTATVQGRLVNTSGSPVANAIVQWSIVGSVQGETGSTDSGGHFAFEIPATSPGQIQVATIANLYLPTQTTVQFVPGQTTRPRIVLTPKPSTQIGTVTGAVQDSLTRRPIPKATVAILGAGGILSTTTNAQGTFSLRSVGFNSNLTLQATTILPPCIPPTQVPFAVNQSNVTVNVQAARVHNTPTPNCGPGLTGPNGPGSVLSIDDTLQWHQADSLAIQSNSTPNAWHAGDVNDILRPPPGTGLIVAPNEGGVWIIAENPPRTAIPLSNTWPSITMNALSFGVSGSSDVYAGTWNNAPSSEGGDLWETDTSQSFPLFNWLQVNPKPPCISINKILVINEASTIVLACDGGLWWSPIPPPPSVHGTYNWKQALPAAIGARSFSGLAKGTGWSAGGGLTGTIVAARWGGIAPVQIIYTAKWSGGNLALTASSVAPPASPQLGRTSVAACASNPQVMFAVAADGNDTNLSAVWHSGDGGSNWNLVSSPPSPGKQGGYNNAIAVAPDCSAEALGWSTGTYTSFDGGGSWNLLSDSGEYSNLHPDVHAVVFDPADPTTLFIGSDGGVASASGLIKGGTPTFESDWSRELLNLEFYEGAASASANGLIAAAAQDNGVLYTDLPNAWQHATNCVCDGVRTFFATPASIGVGNDLLIEESSGGSNFFPYNFMESMSGVIPFGGETAIPVSPPNPPNLKGWVSAPVRFPGGYANAAGQAMIGVDAVGSNLYGLFSNNDGSNVNWEPLRQIGGGQNAAAVAPTYNGGSVFVGTDTGNIYRFDAPYNTPALLLTINPPLSGSAKLGGIYAFFSTVAYATYNINGSGYVMFWNGVTWDSVGTAILPHNLPFQSMMAKDLNTLYVSSSAGVYDTHDAGNSWSMASIGLPVNITQFNDLHLVTEPSGTTYLYMATYGRSLWRTVVP
jgi:hypothetical protein